MINFYKTGTVSRFDSITGFPRSVYGLDFSNTTNHMGAVCADGSIHIYTVKIEGMTDRMPESARTFGSGSEEEFKEEEFN